MDDSGEPLQIATNFFDELMVEASASVKFVSDGSQESEEPSCVTLTINSKDVGEQILASLKANNIVIPTVNPVLRPTILEPTAAVPPSSVKATSFTETRAPKIEITKVEKLPVGEKCQVFCPHMDGIDSIYFQYAA